MMIQHLNKYLIICLIFAFVLPCCGQDEKGDGLISPDKKFSISSLAGGADNAELTLVFKRIGGDQIDKFPIYYYPVLKVSWADDSKAVAMVFHIAGGSFVEIFSLSHDHWKRYEIQAPISKSAKISVVSVDVEKDRFVFGSAVSLIDDKGRPVGKFSLCKYVVAFSDPSLCRLLSDSALTREKYSGLKFIGESQSLRGLNRY